MNFLQRLVFSCVSQFVDLPILPSFVSPPPNQPSRSAKTYGTAAGNPLIDSSSTKFCFSPGRLLTLPLESGKLLWILFSLSSVSTRPSSTDICCLRWVFFFFLVLDDPPSSGRPYPNLTFCPTFFCSVVWLAHDLNRVDPPPTPSSAQPLVPSLYGFHSLTPLP